ncbi:tyrosine-type recombinase/integrase [Microbispora rosea]|uniref:tyrosine-type recombinase/integrase n=1 Tax=Microbispora rosea TaxID=58117 RepID=UPI0018CC45E2|nr:site-specific integrase [Microbispora rosea]
MASSIKGVVDTLGAIFEVAVDDQVVGRNPVKAESVKPPAPARKKVVPWTLGQVAAMAAALGELYGPMVFLSAGCAHRPGELFGVAVEDLDFLGRMVHVNRQVRLIGRRLVSSPPKRGKTRTVPLPESLGLRLSAHIAQHPPVEVTLPWVEKGKPGSDLVTVELLFSGPNGAALHRNTFNHTWRVSFERAGIVASPARGERRKSHREPGCHVLWHTAASAWRGTGVDIRTIAEYLGHADPGLRSGHTHT